MQNKFKEDMNLAKELAKLLSERDLGELEFSKVISKDSSVSIKIKKSLENYEVTMQSKPAPQAMASKIELEESKVDKDENLKGSLAYLRSPMVGTAYLSPDPNSEPFVKVGDIVKEGQPMLIIEAMKTMNHIPANKAGTVKNILVENGSPVEFGDPLILIE